MRSVPQIIHAVEHLVFKGKEIEASNLSKENYSNYRKIKDTLNSNKHLDSRELKINSSLKDELYGLIFGFIPSKSRYSLAQRNIVEIIKQTALADLLVGLISRKSSIELYKSIFTRSKKYDYTGGTLSSSRVLFAEEARQGNINKAYNYYQTCQKALEITQNEIKSEWYSAELQNHFSKTKEITHELNVKAEKYFKELNAISEEFRGKKFYRNFFTVAIIYFESAFDFDSLCDFLEERLRHFELNFPDDRFTILLLRLYFINYLLRIKVTDKALEQIEIGLETCIPKSRQWFRLYELKMLHGLRVGDYETTILIYNKLKPETRFNSLNQESKNRIELNWLYALISKAMTAGRKEGANMMSEVRLGRYLNSIPDFFVDKKGMNVAIIIVQLLYYIITKDLDKLDSRFEAVEKYLSRYMKSDPLFRSHSFVKLLLQVPKQNFHPVAVERHAVKYYKNLTSISFLESHHPNEIEIVEYEILWDHLMAFLKDRS